MEDIDPILPSFHFVLLIDIVLISKIYQNFHFLFLIDIDPNFKIFKKFQDRPSGLFGARFFQNYQSFRLPKCCNFPNSYFWKMIWELSWIIWSVLVSPKIPKSWTWWVFGFSHNEIDKLLVPSEAEWVYGAFWLFFQSCFQ